MRTTLANGPAGTQLCQPQPAPISGLARDVIGRRRPSPSACCAATAAFASVQVAEIVADWAAAISSLVSVSGEDVPLMQG